MPPAEKRRRKKSRIQNNDSSSSESEVSDVEMRAEELSAPSELSDAGEDGPEPAAEPAARRVDSGETPRERLRKLPNDETSQEFNQTFLRLVTEQFGEDLAALRQANDFGPASLNQLIAGLKQGIDIFTPEQQRML